MTEPVADATIQRLAEELRVRKRQLGGSYWQDAEVVDLQEQLRHELARYPLAAAHGVAANERARRLARYQSECAVLIWPGHGDD
jgi:hypothetical protein